MKNISVAMAVYNGEKYIQKQIDSILSQLNDQDELIISYDKSSDGTWDIIKEYEEKYPQVKIVENPNPGVFGNFENAIVNCTKDYVFISDQDDVWAPDKKAEVLKCFAETGSDMVIHSGYHIDQEDNIISESFFKMSDIKSDPVRNFVKPAYSGCCTAFTKEFKKIIVPIPRRVGAYDHWIGMTGELLGKITFLDKPLLYHRLHEGNVTPVHRRPLKTIASARFNLACCLLVRGILNRGRHGR